MNYQYLLFDADETLFDFSLAEEQAFFALLEEQKIEDPSRYFEFFHQINQSLWKEVELGNLTQQKLQATRFVPLIERLAVSASGQEWNDRFLFHLAHQSRLFPKTKELLERLSKQYTLALCTNGIGKVQRSRLALSGIESFFSGVFISEELGVSKPKEAFFELVKEGLSLPKDAKVLMIGDSLTSDMKGGLLAGFDVCWVNRKKTENLQQLPIHYEISDLLTLETILGKND